MDVRDLQALSTLLDELLDLDSAARVVRVAELRAAGHPLAARVAAVLEASARETGELVDRGPRLPDDEPAAFASGQAIGPYRLHHRLGVGGMGEVWQAERSDGQVRRPVALKLPAVGLRRAELVRRFARERDILASLAHPNIARLWDAGVADDGQPYLALELVDGLPITDHARPLPLRERVQLLLQVADAVQAAHASLVIHRDLKPSNVLVTRDGRAMLLDFGIAKLLAPDAVEAGATELTQVGGAALTPAYAAPEQIAGRPVSTATDVWALGVLLYELLAGQRPFEGGRHALERQILEVDPPRPPRVPADLGTIALHALRKVPAERYPTAEAFAADLRRWLDGLPVQAQSHRWGYRVRKFVARHRVPVALSVLVAAALAISALVATSQAREARAQAERARNEAAVSAAVQEFLEGIFKASSGDQPDPAAARQRTALQLLDEGAARVDRALGDAPAAKLRVLDTLAQVYEDMGLLERAASLRGRMAAVASQAFGAGSNEQIRALSAQAQSLNASGRREQALSVLAEADRLLGARRDVDADTRIALDIAIADLHNYSTDTRGLPHAERALALLRQREPSGLWVDALSLVGGLRSAAGDFDGARRAYAEAVEVAGRLPGGLASKMPALYDLWGYTEIDGGRANEGLALLRKVVALDDAASGSSSEYALGSRSRLVGALIGEGRWREAAAALDDLDRQAAQYRAAEEPTRAARLSHRVRLLLARGQAREAAAVLATLPPARDVARRYATVGLALQVLRGEAAQALGDGRAAEAALGEADALAGELGLGPTGWTARIGQARVQTRLARGDTAAARDALQAMLAARWSPQLPPSVRPQLEAAVALADGRAAEAEAIAARTLDAIEAGGPMARGRGRVEPELQRVLGEARINLQRPTEALPPLQRALATLAALDDPERSVEIAAVHLALARALAAAARSDDARRHLAAAQAIHRARDSVPPVQAAELAAVRALLSPGPAPAARHR